MPVQPVSQGTLGVGFTQRYVVITNYIAERGMVACQEVNTLRELTIPAVPMRLRLPRVGEMWIVERLGGQWCFMAIMQSPSIFQSTTVAAVAPPTPLPDDVWIDTSGTTTVVLKVWSGTAWRSQA